MSIETWTFIVGSAAGICSMASFVPQLWKILRERDATGVSLRMFAVTIAAFALWTTFGLLQGAWPIIISNGVCMALAVSIFTLRLRFGENGAGVRQDQAKVTTLQSRVRLKTSTDTE